MLPLLYAFSLYVSSKERERRGGGKGRRGGEGEREGEGEIAKLALTAVIRRAFIHSLTHSQFPSDCGSTRLLVASLKDNEGMGSLLVSLGRTRWRGRMCR